jgi:hypothetical protein
VHGDKSSIHLADANYPDNGDKGGLTVDHLDKVRRNGVDAAIVCWRGLLSKFFVTPYTRKAWPGRGDLCVQTHFAMKIMLLYFWFSSFLSFIF